MSASVLAPVAELDLRTVYAKTEALGSLIAAKTWQADRDPVFLWELENPGAPVVGYSYALDATPDDIVDTAATSFDVATSALHQLADGTHTFAVKAINSAGNAGPAASVETWVDTTPPQVGAYSPTPAALLNAKTPSVAATLSDTASGVDKNSLKLLINGSATSTTFDPKTGALTTTGGAWKEGANSLELRAADLVGNTLTPLLWSVTLDTMPPTGSLLINGGAEMTTSLYVTLALRASDATSGVARILLSNEKETEYVEEPYVALRELWKLKAVRGLQSVYVKFVDRAGNVSAPVSDGIDVGLLAPDTVITSGPAGSLPSRTASFTFMCPEGGCLFSVAFDNEVWSAWSDATSVAKTDLVFGNHYFRVKAAKEVNGIPDIQPDEEDPSPAERTWVVGVESPILTMPRGSPIKVWRLE